MYINWRAVLIGFVTAVVLDVFVSLVYPPAETTGLGLALPGLVGGFVAGYTVSGIERGGVHGGLATIVGALAVLAVIVVAGVLFVGPVPAIGGSIVAIVSLFVMAIPGGIAGALGGWLKGRSETPMGVARPVERPSSVVRSLPVDPVMFPTHLVSHTASRRHRLPIRACRVERPANGVRPPLAAASSHKGRSGSSRLSADLMYGAIAFSSIGTTER